MMEEEEIRRRIRNYIAFLIDSFLMVLMDSFKVGPTASKQA